MYNIVKEDTVTSAESEEKSSRARMRKSEVRLTEIGSYRGLGLGIDQPQF